MNLSTLIQVTAGQTCPRELIEATLKNCPSVSGFAVRDGDGINYEYYDKTTTVENIMKLVEFTKEHELFLFFANWPAGSDGKVTADAKKDIQPFVLLTGDGDDATTHVAYFLEGDFSKYAKAGRTDEGNLSSDLIDPMLADIFENVEGDPAKFSAKIHSPLFAAQLKATLGHRGCFAFLPQHGDPVMFGENDLGGSYDWGNTSNRWGFGDVKKEAAPIIAAASAAGKAVKNKFSSFLQGTTEPAKAPTPAPEAPHPDATPKAPVVPEVPKTETAVKAPDATGMVAIRVPPKLEKSAKNAWMRLMSPNGELPKNHQDKNVVLLVPQEIATVVEAKNFLTKSHVEGAEKEVRALWKKHAAPAAASPTKTTSQPTSDYLPTMSDAEMSELTTLLASWMDRDQDKRPTPLQIQEAEAKWPLFSEKAGIPLQDIMWWPVADIQVWTGNKAVTMLILELRRFYGNSLDIKGLVNSAAPKTKPVASGQPPIIPAEVPPVQSKTAVKGNFLGLKSRAA